MIGIVSKPRLLAFAVAISALLGAEHNAKADLRLTLTGTDGSSANGIETTPGNVIYYGIVTGGSGQFSTAITAGTSNSPGGNTSPGGPSNTAQISINAMTVSSTGAGTLTIELSDNGFNIPTAGPGLHLASNVLTSSGGNPTPGVSFTFQSYANNNNTDFSTSGATTTGVQGPYAVIPAVSNVNNTVTTGFTRTSNAFSLTEQVVITFTQAGSVSLTGTTNVFAPEPSTLAMICTGVPVALLGLRRRRRIKVDASA